MSVFSISCADKGGVPVFSVEGYFQKECGIELHDEIKKKLLAGSKDLIIDFEKCKVINSQGISSLMDIVMMLKDDFQGRVVMSGLDALKIKAFKVVGLMGSILTAASIEDGLEALS